MTDYVAMTDYGNGLANKYPTKLFLGLCMLGRKKYTVRNGFCRVGCVSGKPGG